MVYLDYSATTPVNKEVLETFNKCCLDFLGNSNSLHKLGVRCNKLINEATIQIASLFNVLPSGIIYTSGSTESNNTALIGVALRNKNKGNKIITTKYEHSSVIESLNYLKTLGFVIEYVKTDLFGRVDLNNLKEILDDNTILVTINCVNSEIGIRQPIEEIADIIKKNSNAYFHTDLTQAVGKCKFDLKNVDLASFSAHKFFGLKGIGVLIKKENVHMNNLIHGGKSTTIYRSGTPAHPLIASLAKSVRMALEDLENKINYVSELNVYLTQELNKISGVHVNSNIYSIPYILNFSIKGIKAETMLHALEEKDIYVSTKSACSDEDAISEAVYDLTKDLDLAKSSIRISLSHLTTKEELNYFVDSFKDCLNKLLLK